MPHIIIQYSENLASLINMQELLRVLQSTLAAQTEAKIDAARIAVRAYGTPHFIATEEFPDAFIHIEIRLLKGRSPEVRKTLAAALQEKARAFARNSGLKICVTAEPVELAEGYCGSTHFL